MSSFAIKKGWKVWKETAWCWSHIPQLTVEIILSVLPMGKEAHFLSSVNFLSFLGAQETIDDNQYLSNIFWAGARN